MQDDDEQDPSQTRRRFTIIDQRGQQVETQHNTVIDQRDQRDQRVENQYWINGDPTAILATLNRTNSGVLFQPKVFGLWLVLSFFITIVFALSSAPSSKVISGYDFMVVNFALSVSFTFYGLIGIVIQAAHHYQWKTSNVRNSWLVWSFYPMLSLIVIAIWIVRMMCRYSPKLFGNRFWF